ncbi:MAG: hypothetical protein H7241_11975, partial [Novosphingobium sp.]|nr:hypothetical protein [Novosphingobium sp.]
MTTARVHRTEPASLAVAGAAPNSEPPFWSKSVDEICAVLKCSEDGLSAAEAQTRLAHYGPNSDA